MKEFITIDELSEYLRIKKSTLYSMVESGELVHYRIGRLIRFKRSDVDRWMERNKYECVSVDSKAGSVLKAVNKGSLKIDNIIKKSIAEGKRNRYTPNHGRLDQVKGLRKEVENGNL